MAGGRLLIEGVRLPVTWPLRQAVRDNTQHRRVPAHADMAALNLDVLHARARHGVVCVCIERRANGGSEMRVFSGRALLRRHNS